MKSLCRILSISVALIMVIYHQTEAYAADFWVSNPMEFQGALNAASDNGNSDTIHVAPGTYDIDNVLHYQVNNSDEDLTIIAADPANPPVLNGVHENTIMGIQTFIFTDGNPSNDNGLTVTIDGIVYQHSAGVHYRGLYIDAIHADFIIKNCLFKNNRIEQDSGNGGGLYLLIRDDGNITLHNNSFSGNSAVNCGGGIYVDSRGTFVITDNTFYENSAGFGGGLYMDERAKLLIKNNSFSGNAAIHRGGGAFIMWDHESMTFTNNLFSGNLGDTGGGASIHIGNEPMTFTNNSIWNNVSSSYYGGGIVIYGYNGDFAQASLLQQHLLE